MQPPAAKAVRMQPLGGLEVVVFVAPTRGLTAKARAVLPASVPYPDAAFNVARAALLVHALTTDPSVLLEASADRLHQQYRAAQMPATSALVARLREAGVPAVVSGAGPSVLAFLVSGPYARRSLPSPPEGWCSRSLLPSSVGARIV
jgi:homoserine kinase